MKGCVFVYTENSLFYKGLEAKSFVNHENAENLKGSDNLTKELNIIFEELKDKHEHYLGYPFNLELNYSFLGKFLNLQLNNLGDAFYNSTINIDTKTQERSILKFFAKLYKLPWEDTWGYVGNGGTEGNLCGMLIARERFPEGIFYMSESTHYSVKKNAWILGKNSVIVKSKETGEFDYDDFAEKIDNNKNKPVIIVATIGTTMSGGIDDIKKIQDILKIKNIKDFYIHCDAALSGGMIPFMEEGPDINFEKLPLDSIAISGHKFIGCPMPAGIILARKKYVKQILDKSDVSYVGTKDTTITGCRNGLSVLLLWLQIRRKGINGFRDETKNCLENTEYAKRKLDNINWENSLNKWANTIVIKKPSEKICKFWSLACEGDKAHIIIMQHVKRDTIDKFIEDLKNEQTVNNKYN
jgi:histidine decarboxylase